MREELPPITTFLNRLLALPIDGQNKLFEEFEVLLTARIEGAIAAGLYDQGLKTLTGEKLLVTSRETLACHGDSGAETSLLTIEQHEKLNPIFLEEILASRKRGDRLLVNERTGRAALATKAPSLLGEDGEIIERLRLQRPLSRESMALADLEHSFWKEVDADAFVAAWQDELKSLPETRVNVLYLVTGLLLPVWQKLPRRSCRIFRLTPSGGERLIGRLIRHDDLADLRLAFGLDAGDCALSPAAAMGLLLSEARPITLRDGLTLRRAKVMGRDRIELTGFGETSVPALKALGLVSEIIAWRLRLFVPLGESCEVVIARLFEQAPPSGL